MTKTKSLVAIGAIVALGAGTIAAKGYTSSAPVGPQAGDYSCSWTYRSAVVQLVVPRDALAPGEHMNGICNTVTGSGLGWRYIGHVQPNLPVACHYSPPDGSRWVVYGRNSDTNAPCQQLKPNAQ